MADIRIIGGGQNDAGGIVAAEVRNLARAKALVMVQVNVSGDIVNPGGGGAGGTTNLTQINGVTVSVGSGTIDTGTLRVVVASDDTILVSPPVTGVQIVGGGGGSVSPSGDFAIRLGAATAPIGVSGDVSTIPKAGQTWPVSFPSGVTIGAATAPIGVSGDVSTTPKAGQTWPVSFSGQIGTQIIGGSVGAQVQPSGDFPVRIGSATAGIGVTGDVSTIPKAGQTWPISFSGQIGVNIVGGSVGGKFSSSGDTLLVSQQGPIGVQIIGGGTNRVSISGDALGVNQLGAWATSITGDVLLRANPGVNIGNVNLAGVLGVQIVGGGTARVSISGDTLATSQQGAYATAITGDVLLRANPGVVIGQLGATVGVQIIGGAVGGSVGISGDVLLRANPSVIIGQIGNTVGVNVIGGSIGGTFSASGDINVRQQVVVGVQIVGGSVGARVSISGDTLAVFQSGGWASAITGDVLLRANPATVIGQLGATVGVNIIGGSVGGRVSISGDQLNVSQQGVVGIQIVGGAVGGSVGVSGDIQSKQVGAWAVAVTGDVLLRQLTGNTPIGTLGTPIGVNVIGGSVGARISASGDLTVREQAVLGVQIVGGAVGGTVGVSGDVSVKPSTTSNIGNFPVSGDQAIVDGATRSTKATVRGYTRANPIAVALVNVSGDDYAPTPKEPICATIPFNVTTAGTTTIAGPYNGRVIKVCDYSLQGSSDIATAQCHFGSAASGSQLTPDWLLAVREGVVKSVSPVGGGYIFKTLLNQALVLELSAGSVRGSVSFHSGDAN